MYVFSFFRQKANYQIGNDEIGDYLLNWLFAKLRISLLPAKQFMRSAVAKT